MVLWILLRMQGQNIPVALHLDHGDTFELCVSCIETGFFFCDDRWFQVIPLKTILLLLKKVVEYAHAHDVSVEGELGVLAGIEDDVQHEVFLHILNLKK